MPGYAERMTRARTAIDQARESGIPVIFIQEVHRPDLVDFGRELDGSEDVHCIETHPGTDIAVEQMEFSGYGLPDQETALLGFLRHRFRNSAAWPEGRHFAALWWADRRLRAL